MAGSGPNIALFYDDAGYVETLKPPRQPAAEAPVGLMGRQVAGKEFLDAYLTHGTWTELVALVHDRSRAQTLVRLCQTHPSSQPKKRRLQIVEEREFHARFFPEPPARLLWTPAPPDVKYAWARQYGGPCAFALSGVTHTLCSAGSVHQLCSLVTAPYESFDTLICTSRAVLEMVRAVSGAYADYLRERHGGTPSVRARLEVIPLGVNPDRFHPPTAEERAARRRAFGIHDDEVAVLFVGRLSHHGKAHPFPMFRGLARASRQTRQKVHLLLAGWAAHPAVHRAFVDGARVFAPNVRLSVLDGVDPTVRFRAWHAADLFTSLSDNIQETFGLVVIEAMACGLPVVASDWNGYRDLVVSGETGLLVPTTMVRDATASSTSRLLVGEVDYDQFLGECSQAAAVDVPAAAETYARLLSDAALRRQMGDAGRRRVLERFTWERVIGAYESLWHEQEAERQGQAAREERPRRAPACYPAPEHSFAGYPTAWLSEDDRLQADEDARAELEMFLNMPLTNHVAESRVRDAALLRAVLTAAAEPRSLSDLEATLRAGGAVPTAGRAALAWLIKYGLLRIVRSENTAEKEMP